MPDLPTIDADSELLRIDAAQAEESLPAFIKGAWEVIEPGTAYLHNWHIDCVCDYLAAVDAGQITRLLVNVPPRYMKSRLISVFWPVYSWLKHPELRWLFATYAANLSTEHSVDRRTILQSDWFQQRWGDRFRLTSDVNLKTEFQNHRRGRMFATSFDASVTGKGGDRLVIDDPHDTKKAESDTQREATIRTFDRKLSTRLNNKKTGAIVVVMQRLHQKDLSARCIELGYTHLCLPAEDAPHKTISTPLKRQYTRDSSGLLWPAREGPAEIAQAKQQLRPYGYAGQYQQRPAPAGGGIFKSAWFCFYKREGENYRLDNQRQTWIVKRSDCRRFAVMDVAASDSADAAYSVLQVWDITPSHDLLLLDQWREKAQIPDAVDAVVRMLRQWEVPIMGIERNGVGLAVLQTLIRRGVTVRGLLADRDKVTRSVPAQIRMENRTVHFPEGAAFVPELCGELENFPTGMYLDQTDALAWACIFATKLGAGDAVRKHVDEAASQQMMQRLEEEAKAQEAELAEQRQHHPGRSIPAAAVTVGAAMDDAEAMEWLNGHTDNRPA